MTPSTIHIMHQPHIHQSTRLRHGGMSQKQQQQM
nr:MAG TPA: hypothetical protein [Caudoviricetes sp.]